MLKLNAEAPDSFPVVDVDFVLKKLASGGASLLTLWFSAVSIIPPVNRIRISFINH